MFRLLFPSLVCGVVALSGAAREPNIKPSRSAPSDSETRLRVQVFLDGELFCPGKIDGDLGEFTLKAVVNYNFAHGHKDLSDWSLVIADAQRRIAQSTVEHIVKPEFWDFINPDLPENPQEWQNFQFMSYRSAAELIAERFHTDETFLQKLNPKLRLENVKAGDTLVVPNVKPFRIESVKKYQGFKEDAKLSRHTVVIDTTERMGAVYDESEHMLAAFPITPGKPQFIPRGQWRIVSMTTTPNFRYDKQFLEQGTRSTEAFAIPPGPNSPVGILWAGLSKSGIGLHGTASPRTIGRAQSAGCVRFANWDAIRLPLLVRPGSPVIVK